MAEAGLPPHGSDATRPTNTAMSALAQLAQGRELGRSVGPLIQLLLDQGTPHLARSAAYDALIAGGLSDEGARACAAECFCDVEACILGVDTLPCLSLRDRHSLPTQVTSFPLV